MKSLQMIISAVCFVTGCIAGILFSYYNPTTSHRAIISPHDTLLTEPLNNQSKQTVKKTAGLQDHLQILSGELFDSLPESSQQKVSATTKQALFQELVQYDPARAAGIFFTMPLDERDSILYALVNAWCSDDPASAYKWLSQNKNALGDDVVEAYKQTTLDQIAHKDPAGALNFLYDINDQQERENFILQIAEGWASKDINEALIFLNGLSNQQISKKILNESYLRVIRQYVQSDPEAAALYVKKLAPGDMQTRLVDVIVEDIVPKNFGSATDWVTSLNDAEAMDSGMNVIMDGFKDENLDYLVASVIANQGNLKSETIARAISKLAAQDPHAASDIVGQIHQSARADTIKAIAGNWLNVDDLEATRWVDSIQERELYEIGSEQVAIYYASSNPTFAIEWASVLSEPEIRLNTMLLIAEQTEIKQMNSLITAAKDLNFPESEYRILAQAVNRRLNEASFSATAP